MAYDYLFELYTILDRTRTGARERMRTAEGAGERKEIAYQRGVSEFAREMEEFLAVNYNRMLPRKMRERLEKDGIKAIT